MLQAFDCRTDQAEDWQVQDLLRKTRNALTSRSGEFAFAVRTMRRLPPRSFPTMGYTVHARSANARSELIYHVDIRREALPERWFVGAQSLSEVYEAAPKARWKDPLVSY